MTNNTITQITDTLLAKNGNNLSIGRADATLLVQYIKKLEASASEGFVLADIIKAEAFTERRDDIREMANKYQGSIIKARTVGSTKKK